MKVALYRDSVDVSEVGSTGLGDFIAMDALHSFNSREIGLLDRETAFLPEAWRGGALGTDYQQWGVPWLVGTRLLHYRRNLLARGYGRTRWAEARSPQDENFARCGRGRRRSLENAVLYPEFEICAGGHRVVTRPGKEGGRQRL